MKAIVYRNYGPPENLMLEEVPTPEPKDDEVLVKVHAVSLNSADNRMLRADPFPIRFYSGLAKPSYNILGIDIAGTVEAVGKSVTQFKVGDEVYGDLSKSGWGGFAEYVCAREYALAPKPAGLTFEQAAAIPTAAGTAFTARRDAGRVRAGQSVLIYGASGGVGLFAVQLAKSLGAEVTAVCSTRNLDLVRTAGADRVIDYKAEDFTARGVQYDLIIGANGYRSLCDYKHTLKQDGVYANTGGAMRQIFAAAPVGPVLSMFGKKKLTAVSFTQNQQILFDLKAHFEASGIVPVIDRSYPLEELPEAMRYFEDQHTQGKVVITCGGAA